MSGFSAVTAFARARDDFEGLRQKAEDTFTDHFNEFRRRYEVLIKTRGTDSGVPYADYDLRDLLLKSLYAPAWSAYGRSTAKPQGRFQRLTMRWH